jgi:uncharacterized damage-inducible protein DinB
VQIVDGASFVKYWENIRARTVRVAECVPREDLEWRPAPGTFSFGDILRHLGAIERWMFAENAQGLLSRYPGHGRELADGYDAVMRYLRAMHEEAVAIFGRLNQDELHGPCTTPGGARMPVWKWLRAMVEHEVHHRGQLYLMLRLIDVPTPPLYGLTSEEVRERSAPFPVAESGPNG